MYRNSRKTTVSVHKYLDKLKKTWEYKINMKEDLQNKIYAIYPELYREKDLDMYVSCMVWGIDCGAGWFNLLKTLTLGIKAIDAHYGTETIAKQVKEKFGTLRFYFGVRHKDREVSSLVDDIISQMVDGAEVESGSTCETCGEFGQVRKHHGWYMSRCNKCLVPEKQCDTLYAPDKKCEDCKEEK